MIDMRARTGGASASIAATGAGGTICAMLCTPRSAAAPRTPVAVSACAASSKRSNTFPCAARAASPRRAVSSRACCSTAARAATSAVASIAHIAASAAARSAAASATASTAVPSSAPPSSAAGAAAIPLATCFTLARPAAEGRAGRGGESCAARDAARAALRVALASCASSRASANDSRRDIARCTLARSERM